MSSIVPKRLFVIICWSFLLSASAYSFTEKRGVIADDERWTQEKGPYVITDDILIDRSARLVIGPGTRIYVGQPHAYDKKIVQRDYADSFSVSITVKGVLSCVGRRNNRISFSPLKDDSVSTRWYGIVLDEAVDPFTEIAYTDIAGAYQGITVSGCSPLIRNVATEFNNVGIICRDKAFPDIFNTIAAHNFVAGIRILHSNPRIYNSIFVFNRNHGVWSDGVSAMHFSNNCVFGNGDRDLHGCDPELGVLFDLNHNSDSIDYNGNLYTDPIFAGSPAESLAVEQDSRLPSDRSDVKDTSLVKILHNHLPDSTAHRRRLGTYRRYELSPYSPCVDAGKKGKDFQDIDGSRNDIGLWGGQEFYDREAY
ncbi:MAG: right-handed parallel beta-helix repeat-containing protein [Chitinispirillaceae bacterium]